MCPILTPTVLEPSIGRLELFESQRRDSRELLVDVGAQAVERLGRSLPRVSSYSVSVRNSRAGS